MKNSKVTVALLLSISIIGIVVLLLFSIFSTACAAVTLQEATQQREGLLSRKQNLESAKDSMHQAAECLRALNSDVYSESIVSLQNSWIECASELENVECKLSELDSQITELEKALPKEKYSGIYEATAYCIHGTTSTGVHTQRGVTIAVDPKVIPYGTKLHLYVHSTGEDLGYRIAQDCGGAIKGNRLDIYMDTASECKQWGRRKVDVYIVD